jgi:antitoxin VapB
MGEEYRGKVFKSGNSLALRIPKGLGLREGAEVILREEQHGFRVEPVLPQPKKIDISKFAGKIPWLKPIPPEDREFEERELDWEGKLLKRD